MFYDVMQVVLSNLFRVLFRCEILGEENVPKQGGVIIAANHVSNWDPPFVAAYVSRYVHFMAKQELFDVPVFGFLIRKLHAFPVKRGSSDRAAIKNAIRILKEGECLGLFPEGTRNKGEGLQKPEAGIALIALKANACVVPTAIMGTGKIFTNGSFFPKVKIAYGKPMIFAREQTDKEALQRFSAQIMDEIERLMKLAAEDKK